MRIPVRWVRVWIALACCTLFASLGGNAQTLHDSAVSRTELVWSRTNVGSGFVTDLTLYVGVPQNMPEQTIFSISWDPEPTSFVVDKYGQPIAVLELGAVSPGQSVTARMEVIGLFSEIRWEISPPSVGGLDEGPAEILALYTIDGDYYLITDPLIVSTSNEVVGDETNPYEMAILIHDYVADVIDYDNDLYWDDAVTVLNQGTGSCTEFTFVFIALARAAGLPARYAGGSLPRTPVDGVSTDRSGHRWAEVYLPNYGWIPFDPSGDDVPHGETPTHDRVGAHSRGMITVCGGGTDNTCLGISYMHSAHWSGPTSWDQEWYVTWTDASIPDTASVFRVDQSGQVFADGTLHAGAFGTGFADVAELVTVSEPVEASDILELDPSSPNRYRKSRIACSALVAGVVSTQPGIVMGTAETRLDTTKAALALVGIVRVKVTNEGGPIRPGDLLVTSSTPGHAMRWAMPEPCPCALVGKALEPMTDESGVILVLLTAH